jgi:SAM-dependent methyltransferase
VVEPALSAVERMLGMRERFDYVECGTCGCLQIEPLPRDLERFYSAGDYYTRPRPGAGSGLRDDGSRGEDRGSRALRAMRRGWMRLRLALARLGLRTGRRFGGLGWFVRTSTGLDDPILDVGCGTGRLLRRLDRAGFSDLTGLDERLSGAAGAGTGLRLLATTLEAHRGRYHLVMAHHSFEHVRDPCRAFAAFARLVEPGGWLLIRTPRADGAPRRLYGADWVQLDPPRHLHLHTRQSLERLARASGFRLMSVEDDSGPFQIWGSELYRRHLTLAEAGRGGRRAFAWPRRLAFRLRARALRRSGQGDQACFYLQRATGSEPPARYMKLGRVPMIASASSSASSGSDSPSSPWRISRLCWPSVGGGPRWSSRSKAVSQAGKLG